MSTICKGGHRRCPVADSGPSQQMKQSGRSMHVRPLGVRAFCLGVLVGLGLPGQADARAPEVKAHPPLTELPRERLAQLAPLLRTGDFVLLESDARGWERQVTSITLAKASPQAVREVLIHPERYEDFVRNMIGREVKPGPEGTFDHTWKLSYGVASFSGVNRYRLLPARPDEPVGEVELIDPTGMSHYRWQFIPAAHGGGTIVVVYGFTDVRHSGGLIDKILARAQTLEHGLAIITQLSFHRALCAEAEKHTDAVPPYQRPAPGTPATSFQFLLDRGLLAILRHQGGRLAELSLTDRSRAPLAALRNELAHPERWTYVPSLSRVVAHDPRDGLPVVEIEQSLPLMSWTTHFGVRAAADAPADAPAAAPMSIDLYGLDGDLRGAFLRFDLQPDALSGIQQIVLRGKLAYDRSSVVMRQLFKIEPLFEDGVNVGLTLVILRAVRGEVERRTKTQAILGLP